MNSIIELLLSHYDQEKFYNKKKAEYTLRFIGLLMIYNLISIGISQLFDSNRYSDVLQGVFFLFIFLIMVVLIYYKKIEIAVNLLVITGLLKGLTLASEPIALHFNSYIFIMLVVTAAVYVEKYQLYFIYIVFNGALIYRLLVVGYMDVFEGQIPITLPEYAYTMFGGLTLTIGVTFLIRTIDREINNSEILERASETDTLTKLPNRRRFESLFVKKFTGYEKCILMIDLDHFKTINDTFGHQMGDCVLIDLAKILEDSLRDSDAVFRWGGEEFVIMLRGVPEDLGCLVAERIRHSVASHDFKIERQVTISIGMLHIGTGASTELLSNYLRRADRALYRAKDEGRNRIVLDHKFRLMPVEVLDDLTVSHGAYVERRVIEPVIMKG